MQEKHSLNPASYFQGLTTRGNVFTLTLIVFILFLGAIAFPGFVQPAKAFVEASGVSVSHDAAYAKKEPGGKRPSQTLSTSASLTSNTLSRANIPTSDRDIFSSIFTAHTAEAYVVNSDRFRLSDLDLRDPHMFADFLGCQDITDTQIAGFSINNEIQTDIQADGSDADSFLDSSYVLEFTPFDPAQATMPFAFGTAECTAPLATTVCGSLNGQVVETTATPSTTVDCLSPITGTLRPYAPALATAAIPCFGANLGV
ncbi:MAG: hypothetical protein PSX80_05830, partial [bacterium]|nr:hypothetical protein [bacterium]